MRWAVVSDVHANLEALSAVLDDARTEGVDGIVSLGDVVGYHADPEACIARIRANGAIAIAGNHDRVAAGLDVATDFGPVARRAILWTRAHLSPAARAYLAALPLTRVVEGRFLLFHGALHPVPNADLHLSSAARVRRSIQALQDGPWGVHVAFFGHTHRRVVHVSRRGEITSVEGDTMSLSAGSHYLVNPGSVGQPRDGDPRAAYAIYDDRAGTIRFRRVPFDRETCRAKAAAEGLLEAPPRDPLAGAARLGASLSSLFARRFL